jgi:hypothetical protein
MSLFNKIFGKNSKDKPPTPQEAIQRIRDVEELLGKKSQFLEKKIDDELQVARTNGTKNKRGKLQISIFNFPYYCYLFVYVLGQFKIFV